MDETGQSSGSKGPSAKPEQEYLVAVLIGIHQIPVGIPYICLQSRTKCQAFDLRPFATDCPMTVGGAHGPYAGMIVTALSGIDGQTAVKLRYVRFFRHPVKTVPRPVAANHYLLEHACSSGHGHCHAPRLIGLGEENRG